MRTQNPPPLKACRLDSDLGHNSSEQLVETVYRRLVVVLRLNKLSRAIEFSEKDRQRRSGLKRVSPLGKLID